MFAQSPLKGLRDRGLGELFRQKSETETDTHSFPFLQMKGVYKMNFSQNSLEPPFTDRGVVNTQSLENNKKKEVEMIFDWLQVTIQAHTIDDVLWNMFQTTKDICLHTPSGRFGYNHTYTYGEKIQIMWNDSRTEMGVHLLLSGQACRELEETMGWKTFFDRLQFHHLHTFTRVDVAIDCYKKYFDVNELRQIVLDGKLVSKFRQTTYIEQLNIDDGAQESASLKFGSMSSDIYIVFYDKLAERKNAGSIVDDSVKFWVRCEIRFKHDLANKLIGMYTLNDFNFGNYVQKILYNYIDFKDECADSNKSRWSTSSFWLDFLGVVDKLCIAPKATQSTIERKQKWASLAFSKTAVLLSVVNNHFFESLLKEGMDKITKSDLDILNAHFVQRNITPLSMDDVNAIHMRLLANNYTTLSDALKHEQIQMEGVTL